MINNIELTELTKDEKIFRLYKKMKNKKDIIKDITLFYYIHLTNNVIYLINKRKIIIINYYKDRNYVPTLNDFYDKFLFPNNIMDISHYYDQSQVLVDYIIHNWDHFNPIINTLLFD